MYVIALVRLFSSQDPSLWPPVTHCRYVTASFHPIEFVRSKGGYTAWPAGASRSKRAGLSLANRSPPRKVRPLLAGWVSTMTPRSESQTLFLHMVAYLDKSGKRAFVEAKLNWI